MPDRGAPTPGAAVTVIAVSLILVTTFLGVVGVSTGSGGSRAAVAPEGPYTLTNRTPGITLAYPACAVVTVTWHVASGGSANFSVRPPPIDFPSHCAGPPPTNATCPPWGCGPNGPPVCFESGSGGSCRFTASAAAYTFYLEAPMVVGTTSYNAVGNTTVTFGTVAA
ncbi:MAG TPA: hypothetical protein VMG36_06485 [Thermoplasmata archaeon]|nr:hypothetical protein [Thermoplasmata archaeon]